MHWTTYLSNKKDFFSKSYYDEEGEIWQRGIDRTAHSVIYKAKLFLCHFVKLKLFQMGVQQIARDKSWTEKRNRDCKPQFYEDLFLWRVLSGIWVFIETKINWFFRQHQPWFDTSFDINEFFVRASTLPFEVMNLGILQLGKGCI